ncbi:MAG TPA: hypothetical protein PLX90_09740, partial [Anaerolineales bacterium]|nr:hypothetical protein [Anaerolineales bacterium]
SYFNKSLVQLTVIGVVIFLVWGNKIVRNKIWKDSVFTKAVEVILAIMTFIITVLALYVALR